MYINKNTDISKRYNEVVAKEKLKIIYQEIESLMKRIDSESNYINIENPVTVQSLSNDINKQLDAILCFIGAHNN